MICAVMKKTSLPLPLRYIIRCPTRQRSKWSFQNGLEKTKRTPLAKYIDLQITTVEHST